MWVEGLMSGLLDGLSCASLSIIDAGIIRDVSYSLGVSVGTAELKLVAVLARKSVLL